MTVLVCGASGLLGGAVARHSLYRGVSVRALSRDVSKLADLKTLGAVGVQGDLMDRASLDRACTGVTRVFTSANSILGKGRTSPNRVDRFGNRNLIDAARAAGVRQFVFTSSMAMTQDAVVDFFRVKVETEEYLKKSGLPWVILKPGALLDVWVPMLTASMRKNGSATLFGPGATVSNYIAVDDVAKFVVQIMTRDDVVNEVIELGGPDNLTMSDLLTHTEHALGIKARRRHIPLPLLRFLPTIVRPFNEVAARFMNLGYWSATTPKGFAGWQAAAQRFGVQPMTVREYLERPEVSGQGSQHTS